MGALGVRRGVFGVVGGATVVVAHGHGMLRRGDGSRDVYGEASDKVAVGE